MQNRCGGRKTREQVTNRRVPQLGYYLIITDTNKTEENYLLGLRDSIPHHLQGKLVIKVRKTATQELVNEALDQASIQPQYCEPWIVFDRDQVTDFDKIISQAQKNEVHVGWSNPCIEIWFHAYWHTMPVYSGSVACCSGFAREYQKQTGQKYEKANPSIYAKLCEFGNEDAAIQLASSKLDQHKQNCKQKPSEMCPHAT
ncbi:MAG: RloB family protein [Clostridia bacterium]